MFNFIADKVLAFLKQYALFIFLCLCDIQHIKFCIHDIENVIKTLIYLWNFKMI